MNRHGFTLVEILVTIMIMGILLAVAVPNFNTIMKNANIENQTKELHSALVGARMAAMQNRQRTALFIGPKQYVFKTYSSDTDTNGTVRSTINQTYTMQKVSGSSFADLDVTSDKVEFDVNGLVQANKATYVVTPVNSKVGKNCIVIHTVRTNIGRMSSGTTCTIQ